MSYSCFKAKKIDFTLKWLNHEDNFQPIILIRYISLTYSLILVEANSYFVVGTLGGVGFAGVATPPEGFGFGGVVGAGVTLIAVT